MAQTKYQKLLLKRVDSTFAKWATKESITEKELYGFLHKLKGTSGTIGLYDLSKFCTSQLNILSEENESVIPIYSLTNFKKKIRQFIVGNEELEDVRPEKSFEMLFEDTFVLIIDDDLEFVSYIKDLLSKMGAQVAIALNGKRGIELFYSVRPNFILIDINLPDMEGFEVLDQIADIANARHVPVAITSVDQSRENKIKTYERGAMDFIAKPIDTKIFIQYLLNREKLRKKIDESIVTDGLTGVGNRRYFDEMLTHFAESYNRTGTPFSLVMLDLDNFKKVNDMHGHPAGDEVLRKIGEIALRLKRDNDYVFRYGGEEFAVIINNTEADGAEPLIDRIRAEFNEIVFESGKHSFSVQFSAGIATFEGDVEKVVSSADQALYLAKRTGRNKTLIYQSDIISLKRKLNIVIVDDDTLIRTMLHEKLNEWKPGEIDVTVQVFSNGPEFLATDWYNPEEHYIVLLDGIMPGMDGLEVLGRLKNEYKESNVIVAMMTARTGESDIKAALWLGADDYIMKPFKTVDVMKRIKHLANRLFT